MDISEMRDCEKQIQYNHECLLSSFLKENHFGYSNIFHNVGNKVLGQALYDVMKDLVIISKASWHLDKEDFYFWVDEIFEELDK